MTAIPSSWLIGAIVLESSATIVVDGVNNAVIPAGAYYLYDPTASLSLLDEILAQVTPFMTTPAIFVGQDRKIRVTAGASFTWAIPAALQDALGFGASIPSTTSATAADVSELLWSPGWCATTIGHPSGTEGWERTARVQLSSTSGLSTDTVIHGTNAIIAALRWAQVLRARAWTEGEQNGAPGDFRRFWRVVLDPGHRWKWYPEMIEDESSGAAVVYTTPLGPYVDTGAKGDWWSRSIANSDTYSGVSIDAIKTSEL